MRGPLRAAVASLLAIVTLRLRLWDRLLAQRGWVVRVGSWVGVLASFGLLAVLTGLASQFAQTLGPEVTSRGLLVLASAVPVLLFTDALLRVGQGEGMAAALYHYPVSPALIHAGELAAGLASPLILGAGVVLGSALHATGTHATIAVPSALLFGGFLLCFSFILRLGAAALLRRKYLRELALAGSMVVLLGLWVGMASLTGRGDLLVWVLNPPPLPHWVWYLPPAWFVTPGSITAEIPALARWVGVTASPVLVLVAFFFGSRLQDMACYGEAEGMFSGRGKRTRRKGVRLADRWPFRLVHPAVWAAAGKEIRSIRRDPFLILMLTSQGVLLLVMPLLFRSGLLTGRTQPLTGGLWGVYMPFFVMLLVLAKQAPVFNQVAMEGRGLLFLAQVPVARWKLVLGKNLAYFALFGTIDAVFMAVAAWLFGVLPRYPYYLAMASVGLVLMLGVGNLVSVVLPAQWIGARAAAGGSRAAQAAAEGGVERPGCGVTIGRMMAVQFLYVLLVPPLFGLFAARVWLHGGAQVAAGVAVFAWCALVYVVGTSLAVARFGRVEEKLRARFATRGSG
ncbi:MAG: hypothetical protein KDA24_06925 [Deltaproteobacteria bacterium]|nr:hypothetical protein [Deltaproteobacteria bacterium]